MEDDASPAVSLDAIMINSAIEPLEVIYIVTIDKPGPYLHTHSDQEVSIILKGILSGLLVNIYYKLYR